MLNHITPYHPPVIESLPVRVAASLLFLIAIAGITYFTLYLPHYFTL